MDSSKTDDEIKILYDKFLHERSSKGHFSAPSAGSVFKNDAANGIIAGKIVDECGLKGKILGGAKVADWHGNFIINPERKATAKDIFDLTELIKKEVMAKKNIRFDCEILFVGDNL